MDQTGYCKRLIEEDLLIKVISKYARGEKEMRRGHVPLLHIWPATRPPAACRAVVCAALWPDPTDSRCSKTFIETAKKSLVDLANNNLKLLSENTIREFIRLQKDSSLLEEKEQLRHYLSLLIAEFANTNNSTQKDFLTIIRNITSSLKTNANLVCFDPFSGSGTIPLESLRVGMQTIANELNPVAVLLNKVILEFVPKYKEKLSTILLKVINTIEKNLKNELSIYYPSTKDDMPTAYLWARTIISEAPGTSGIPVEVPMLTSMVLSRKAGRFRGMRFKKDKNGKVETNIEIKKYANGEIKKVAIPLIEIVEKKSQVDERTVKRGSVTCPVSGYTTPIASVRKQLGNRFGGANDARMYAVAYDSPGKVRDFRLPWEEDKKAYILALKEHEKYSVQRDYYPDDIIPLMSGVFNAPIYGHNKWSSLFNPRQLLFLKCFSNLIDNCDYLLEGIDAEFKEAVQICLCLILDKLIDNNSAFCGWQKNGPNAAHVFTRWALPMVWDFAEVNPLAGAGGSPRSLSKKFIDGIKNLTFGNYEAGNVLQGDASCQMLPDDSVDLIVTDPPYYNAIPYADISDYFYVWLKKLKCLQNTGLFLQPVSPKNEEIVEMAGWDPVRYKNKDKNFFETKIQETFEKCRIILKPQGIMVVVFAHKSTVGWESLLQALINGGWTITSSWPIDTEMSFRMRGMNSAALNSSVHLVCRPRENPDGSLIIDKIGDWRDVLQELPKRIYEWMPRLEKEGIVGADAIFACIGPALEIYSKYSYVEKANGEKVELKEYLEQVWSAVAKEALNMIFEGAHTEGFEEDSRLTAMWLWTLSTANGTRKGKKLDDEQIVKSSGFYLEFDTARKIAQGLGAHLEKLSNLIEIKGNKARLLPVSERIKKLFGKGSSGVTYKRKKKENQLTLFGELKDIKDQDWSLGDDKSEVGKTVLDRVHQAMILFGAGRGEALRRFLIEEGVGKDDKFWKLAQVLSVLYSGNIDEKRWIDGVLARKKSFGF